MNWRYRDDPLHDYEVLTGRRVGELADFIVLSVNGPDAVIVDLFGDLQVPESGALREAAVDHWLGTSPSPT